MSTQEKIDFAEKWGTGVLNDWETGFIDSVAKWAKSDKGLSPKQEKCLDKIHDKLQAWHRDSGPKGPPDFTEPAPADDSPPF